jgi:hypothetical protein
VAVDRHANDDVRPYIYATSDFGKTWKKLVEGIPEGAFVRAVREDPKRKGLLFAGTESGVYVSKNAGATWEPLQLNLPTTPVHDLVIHENDLVVATHGRSFWILDDISPLRQWSEEAQKASVWLYEPAATYRVHAPRSPKDAPTSGQNPPPGAIIYFAVKETPKNASLEILDSSGKLVRHYSSGVTDLPTEPLDPEDDKPEKQLEIKPGLNRFVWDLRYERAPRIRGYYLFEVAAGARGPLALPGKYQVKLTVEGKTLTAPFELKPDPRLDAPRQDLEAQFSMLMSIRDELSRVYQAADQILDLRKQLAELKERVDREKAKQILVEAQALDERLSAVQDKLINTRNRANEDSLNYGYAIDGSLAALSQVVAGDADSAPTEAAVKRFEKLKAEADGYLRRWSQILASDVPAVERTAAAESLGPLVVKQESR